MILKKWLSKSDKDQLAWCLEYLNEHPRFKNLGIRMSYKSNKNFPLCIFFISSMSPHSIIEEYENIIDRLKKAVSIQIQPKWKK
jgi:ABC-type phosphate/phosphonate transport system substrate-binding protein